MMQDDERRVQEEVRRLRVQREAVRRLAAEDAEELELSSKHLGDKMQEDIPAPEWRIRDLHQVGHNTTLAAAYKTGKSTLMVNLIRSLADGSAFLGEKAVKPVTGTISYWNLEVSDVQMHDWLKQLNIARPELVVPQTLRGKRISLVADSHVDSIIQNLKDNGTEVWVVDPLGRMLSGFPGANGRENNNDIMREVGEILDYIQAEAGVKDLFVATHTGRSGEHTRGATVTDDWPDCLWHMNKRVVIEGDKPIRFLWAEGRGADLDEVPLGFDPETLRVWIEKDLDRIKITGHAQQVVKALVWAGTALNATGMRSAIKGVDNNNGAKEAAVQEAVARGWVIEERGPGTARRFTLNAANDEVETMRLKIKGVEL